MKRTAAIVVTYNRKTLLMENIQCLLAQRPEVPDILIVDNHSTDERRMLWSSISRMGRFFITIPEQISVVPVAFNMVSARQQRRDMNIYGSWMMTACRSSMHWMHCVVPMRS